MKRTNFANTCLITCAAMLSMVVNSCVNKDYDIDKLDTEITLASEGLELPLGKTAPITIKDLLKDMDQEMITALENGTCAFRIGESFPLSDNLPDMNSIISIPDVAFNSSFQIQIADFDSGAFSLNEASFNSDYGIDNSQLNLNIDTPQVNQEFSTALEIYKYAEKANNLSVNLQDTDFQVGVDMNSLPVGTITPGKDENPIPFTAPIAIEETTKDVTIEMDAVEGVSDIKNIKLTPSSNLTIEISVTNSFLTEGSFIPDISIDLDNLMTLEGTGSIITLGSEFALSKSNSFTASKNYKVQAINLHPDNWGANGFSQTNTVKVSGKVSLEDAKTNGDKFNTFLASPNNGQLQLKVNVKYDEIQIQSFTMDIDNIELPQTQTIPLNINNIQIPQEVESVDKVQFNDATSNVTFNMSLENLQNVSGLKVELQSLEIKFPEGLDVEGAVGGKLTYPAEDITNGFSKDITIKSLTLPAPQGGTISYSGNIEVTATAKASGNDVLSSSIPNTADSDGIIKTQVNSTLAIKDYTVKVKAQSKEFDEQAFDFNYDIDAAIAEYGAVTIYPKNDPAINIQIDIPSTALSIKGSQDKGIIVKFPEFIHFKNVPSNFDNTSNTLTIKGENPGTVNLPIDNLTIDPIKENDSYKIKGQVLISGEVVTDATTLHKTDIEEITAPDFKIRLKTTIPAMEAQDVSLVKFEKELNENFDITIFQKKDLPKEIISISEAQLKDVQTNLDFTFSNLPELNTDIEVEASLTFPDVITLNQNDERVSGNTMNIKGIIDSKGKLLVDPVKIDKLDLSGYDFTSDKDLTGKIEVTGKFIAQNPKADINSLGGNIDIDIDVKIPDIKFEKIVGRIDYDIDQFNQNIQLEGLPDFMKDENFVLDFANPHLLLKVKSNLGIPVAADLILTPVYSGTDGTPISCKLNLPASPEASSTITTNFWLANTDNGCPADCIHIEADIRGLLQKIPDQFKLVLDAKTNSQMDGTIQPDSQYTLDVDYEFVAPFEFGDKTHIETEQIVEGLGADIGKLLRKNSLKIGGEITNTLPLQLLLSIELLDSGKNVIPMDEPCQQVLKACASDGSASVTQVDLVLHKNDIDAMENLSALKLKYEVTSPVSGVSVKEDSYLQAVLTIALPEGYTIDFNNNTEE